MTKIERKALLKERYLEYIGYRNKKIKSFNRRQKITGILFTLMPVIITSIFVFGATIVGILYVSNTGQLTADGSSLRRGSFFGNLSKLPIDPLLIPAIKNTLIFTGVSVVITLFSGLIIASLLNVGRKVKGKKLFLTIFFLPQITSEVAITIIFVTLFKNMFNVYEHQENNLWIIIVSSVWMQIASTIVNFNVAFTNIGQTEYNAAKLDGAKSWTIFWKITIPLLAPIISYQLIMLITVGMTAFGQSYIMITAGYVTNIKAVILWPVIGITRVVGGINGQVSNVGLGMIELLLLGLVIFAFIMIANKIQPIGKGK